MSAGTWASGLLLVAAASTAGYFAWTRAAALEPREAKVARAFEEFVVKFGRTYESAEHRAQRFAVFAANLAFIQAENAKGHSYTLGVNEFADQTSEEFTKQHFGFSAPVKPWSGLEHLGTHRFSGALTPTSVDWVAKGAVTDPKNQKHCGSCWSFSTTGALEGAWQIATGNLVSLSEQQLVDCSTQNHGCHGGSMDLAFEYLQKHAVCTEESYPYTAKKGKCGQSNCTTGIPEGSVTGFKDVDSQDQAALEEAVAQQPVSVAIEADQKAFQLYNGGVLSKKCGAKLDHGVLIVGYGTDSKSGMDYWKVKNSWGPSYGEKGYVRIQRGLSKDGECGIKDAPVYPIVKSSTGGSQRDQIIV